MSEWGVYERVSEWEVYERVSEGVGEKESLLYRMVEMRGSRGTHLRHMYERVGERVQ